MADISAILSTQRTELQYDLLWDSYLELPGISPSTLCVGLKSMKHLLYRWNHPGKDTDALRFGRALHAMLLEPKTFEQRYTHWDTRRQGKKYDEFLAQASLDGKQVLSGYQWFAAQEAAKSFCQCVEVKPWIGAGRAEVSALAPIAGVQCRGRMDWVDAYGLPDIKTTMSISRGSFSRDVFKYAYDLKMAVYRELLRINTGETKRVALIAIEKEPPFDVAVMELPEAVLDQGLKKALKVIDRLKRAIDEDHWPGVGEDFDLEVPAWQMMDVDLVGAEEYQTQGEFN